MVAPPKRHAIELHLEKGARPVRDQNSLSFQLLRRSDGEGFLAAGLDLGPFHSGLRIVAGLLLARCEDPKVGLMNSLCDGGVRFLVFRLCLIALKGIEIERLAVSFY